MTAGMSYKSNLSNSVRSASGSYRQNSVHEKLHSTPSTEEKIKFAGDESKDRLYEPKQNKKMVRILTVIIYIFSVSLAAIILSLYYVFFWKLPGAPKTVTKLEMAGATSVELRADNVTNRKPTALPRCLESHDRDNDRVAETVTFPFQIDNPFMETNTTEDGAESITIDTTSLSATEQPSPSPSEPPPEKSSRLTSEMNSILLDTLTKNLYKLSPSFT